MATMTLYKLLARLDEGSFLGLRLWEFSLRSMGRRYGHTFLQRVILRHPLRTLAGLLRYLRLPRQRPPQHGVSLLFEGPEEQFLSGLAGSGKGLLVAVGYCQKPLVPGCPAGRANHDCLYLDRLDLDHGGQAALSACEDCDVWTLGTLALRAGACMHIMTSALDIAHDVMIPSLEGGLFRRFIMCLCPFSVQVIGPPLTLCGLQGYLVGYETGNCAHYEQWLRADEGVKPERTALHTMARSRIITWLEGIAAERAREGRHFTTFRREGNIYVPVEAAEVELPASPKAV
jgi:hypothetical protein